MKNFARNLSVKWRLRSLIIILLLLVVGAGFGGLNGMKAANKSLVDVYEHEVLPLRHLWEMDNLFQIGIVGAMDKALFEEISWAEALKTVKATKADLDKKWTYLHAIETAYSSGRGNAWLAPAKALNTTTEENLSKLIMYLEKKDISNLDIFTDEALYPLANEHRRVINLLVEDRLNADKSEYENAQRRYEQSLLLFLLTMLVSISFSLVFSYFLIRSIDTPLTKMTGAIKQVIKGDLTQHLEFGRHDEFGLLIKGFNQMVTYLRDLVGQIQRSGIQVTSSITELAATNKQQEVTANEHAATTSEIAAQSTQIAATGTHLMATTKKVNSLTKNASSAAEEGQLGLKDIDETMVKMEEATSSIVNKLQILNDKASNIANVVQTINKVADQTNLLSLNAAIEAEKAGEYGSGFAVVATEIRRLADQTAVATFDIAQMVKEVQSAISTAVMSIDKFAENAHASVGNVKAINEQLSGVIEQVEILNPQVETLTEGIAAQTNGAKQISDAIGQLNEGAQQTAESLSQTSSSISQLHQAALGLQEGAARFKVETDDEENVTSPV